VLLLFVFFDLSYISYFNSFYSDTASIVFLLLTAAAYLRMAANTGTSIFTLIPLGLSAILLATSKMQHSFGGVLIAVLILYAFSGLRDRRRLIAASVCAGGIAVASVWMISLIPREYKAAAVYNVVFSHLLPQSASPRDSLRELGLNPEWERYNKTSAFSENSGLRDPAFTKVFAGMASQSALIQYYWSHPSIARGMLHAALRATAAQRPPGFGNFSKTAGVPPNTYATSFSLWSTAKGHIFAIGAVIPVIYAILPMTVLLAAFIHRALSRELFGGALVLWALATSEFLLASLADVFETNRHLLLSNLMYDMLFCSATSWLVVHGRALRRLDKGTSLPL
jgi:hypothetical protein